ncbi:MAG: ArnT family glycosyltransferase [Thermoguttaceae bacterium]
MSRRFLVVAVLMIHTGLLAWSAYRYSPTFDEPAHLVAGISHWQLHRFELYRVNPPLVRMVAALPVLMVGYESDWRGFNDFPGARVELAAGRRFTDANGDRIVWLMTIARWACLPFSLIGAGICYFWARDLYGNVPRVLAILLWCFSPDILAHGSLITPDVPATALGVAACYAFWKWLNQPGWLKTIGSGSLLGFAALTKFTLLVLYPLWPVVWLMYRVGKREKMTLRRWGRELGMLAVATVVSLNVIDLGYGFESPLKPLGEFEFASELFGGAKAEGLSGNRFRGTWLERLPIPFPENMVRGIDAERKDFERGAFESYLRGEFSRVGWWYYYLYGLVIKWPLGTWLLVLLAALSRLSRAGTSAQRRDEFVLLAPLVVITIFVSSQWGLNQHVRYVLPMFPFALIWVSQVARQSRRAVRVAALVAVTWSLGSSLWIYPHSLSYFNELVGGPLGGHGHLLNSNIDWGQDLSFLKQWTKENPEARPLYLVYFGSVDPVRLGVDYQFPELEASANGRPKTKLKLDAGWYAASVNFVRGYAWNAPSGSGGPIWLPKNACTGLLLRKPKATAGYSIFIYHISATDANQVRPELGMRELTVSRKERRE